MVVFSLFFGRLAGMPSDGVPYPIFSYAEARALDVLRGWPDGCGQHAGLELEPGQEGLLPASDPAASGGGGRGRRLRSRLPGAALDDGLLRHRPDGGGRLVAAVVLAGLRDQPWRRPVVVGDERPVRDVRYTLPFIVQMWLFITPIVYPSTILPERWRPLLGINPMAGVVDGFRWALLGVETAPGPIVAVSVVVSLAILFSGLAYFRHMERTFADTI